MTLIIGPLYSGKYTYAKTIQGFSPENTLENVQELANHAQDLTALADRLCSSYEILIATEVGGGVVPIDPEQRFAREQAGRLTCLLAERADRVVRVFCGIPCLLKGEGLC